MVTFTQLSGASGKQKETSGDFQQLPVFHLFANRRFSVLAIEGFCTSYPRCRSQLFLLHELDADLWFVATRFVYVLLAVGTAHRQVSN